MTSPIDAFTQECLFSYPLLYSTLLDFAHSSSELVLMSGSAYRRRVIHVIAEYLALEHEPVKVSQHLYKVEVAKPNGYRCPIEALPSSWWEFETLQLEDIDFQHAASQFPSLLCGISSIALDSAEDTGRRVVFANCMSLEQHACAHAIAEHFDLSHVSVQKGSLAYFSVSSLLKSKQTRSRDLLAEREVENPVLEEIYEQGHCIDSRGAVRRLEAGVTGFSGRYLQSLIIQFGLKDTLEVGMAQGISTLYMCAALDSLGKGGSHAAIDPFQNSSWGGVGVGNVMKAQFSKFTLYEDFSYVILPRLVSEKASFDCVFIDGNHLFDFVLLDCFYAARLLRKGGFLVLDDADLPSVAKVIAFLRRNCHHLQEFPPGCFNRTFTFRKKCLEDFRLWHYYIEF